MNRFTKPLLLAAALLLLTGLGAEKASAQYYAAPNGVGVGCLDPADPCTLVDAVTAAAGGGTIYIRLNNSGAPTVFQESLTAAATVSIPTGVIFDTYLFDAVTLTTTLSADGQGNVDGDVEIDAGATVTIVENLNLALVGNNSLVLQDGAVIDGDGNLVFATNTGTHQIFLGDPADPFSAGPRTATINNLTVNKIGGSVLVLDQGPAGDLDRSDLFITNRLDVTNGLFDLDDNNIHIESLASGIDPGVSIGGGAVIQGDGTFFISIEPAATLVDGFPNERPDGVDAEPFMITGDGNLNMAFDKDTDGGVVIELNEIGTGGISTNRAGSLFVTDATVHNGIFQNLGAARTEFDALSSITSDLLVDGFGETDPTDPDGGADLFLLGVCDGNESGVYFFSAVTVDGSVDLEGTDDPATAGCVEGIDFRADDVPDGVTGVSIIKGVFTADNATGIATGVHLGADLADDAYHNLSIWGNVSFDESPIFTLDAPAEAFGNTDLCEDYTVEAVGNKVMFGGAATQTLVFNTDLEINSVKIMKAATGQSVTITDGNLANFVIDTSLEIIRGNFVTNGLLDADDGGGFAPMTVVINWDGAGIGTLQQGNSARAYISDDPDDTPDKIKYTGTIGIFTASEIPGTTTGSVGNPEVEVSEIEVAMASDGPVVTLSKSVTVTDELRLTQGNLDVGSAVLRLGNELLIAIGNGEIRRSGTPPIFGNLEFPTEYLDPFTVGDDGIDLLYFGTTDRTVGLAWPPSVTTVADRKMDADVIRDVTLDPACGDDITISLRENDDEYRINGDLDIDGGTLEINGNILEMNAVNGNDTDLFVDTDGDLHDAADVVSANLKAVREELDVYRAAVRAGNGASVRPSADLLQALAGLSTAGKTQSHAGLLRFIGEDDTDVFVNTTTGRLRFDFPAIEVDHDEGDVTFDANGVLPTTLPPIAPNRIDVLGTSHFTLVNADLVELLDGLDLLDVRLDYTQWAGEFDMAGISSPCVAPCNVTFQEVSVGGDFIEDNGEFFSSGGDVTVFGDFYLGANMAADPGDALFSLATEGVHTVVGDFRVGPDTDPSEQPDQDDDLRNRYFQGDGATILFGNYYFEGTGDVFDDNAFLLQEQGLRGETVFAGADQQTVWHRQDEDAFFNHVTMAGEGGILLQNDGWQNDSGVLTLLLGIIDTDENQWDWIILNPAFETDLVGRNNSAVGDGVVDLGSRDSYVNGAVQRVVRFGNATGGTILGGYLFPVGTQGDPRDGDVDVDFFRPLILQFADDLGRASVARVDYLTPDELPEGLALPEDGLVVDDIGGTTLTLDVLSDQFWKVEFDRIPSMDPNVRVEAASLPNVFDIKRLRLVQWNCDGTNPRLAGLYDLDVDPTDDASAVLNDFINGIPNLTQEGVEVFECNIIGVASDGNINRIDIPDVTGGFARVQLIHNSPDAGTVDVYVNDRKVWNDADFQTATPFISVPAGPQKVDITAADAPDNSSPAISANLDVVRNVNYAVAVSGNVAGKAPVLQVKDNVRLASSTANTEFFVMHGAPDIGEIDIRTLSPIDKSVTGLLANNINFGDVGGYQFLAPAGYNIEVTNGDNSVQYEVFRFDLSALGDQTFVFLSSGNGSSAAEGFTLIGFDVDGNPIRPQVITATDEETELPTEFTLEGNYPNPFNPSTTIQVNLPETAEVSVQIIDMLGRQVMEIPAKVMEAGAKRSIEVNAVSLASGTYIYRVIANTATDTMIKTGRMTLVK